MSGLPVIEDARYAAQMNASPPASFNGAIALYRAGRLGEARTELLALVKAEPGNGTAWSALGYLHRDIGDAVASAAAFDHALALNAGDPTALNGRARMALERAEPDVLDRYARALAASPGDPRLTLELTEARIERGELQAIDEFARFAAGTPRWTEGQVALVRMRWESRGDPQFAVSARALLANEPRRADLWFGLIELLAEIDQFADAADTARDARAALGDAPELLLREAVNAGRAGEIERADALFARLPANMPHAAAQRALHLVRKNELDRARDVIDGALTGEQAIGAWATAELIYRALDDPRSEWLSGQDGLVRSFDLALDPGLTEQVKSLLLGLHRRGVQAVGQSVRDGTQTRWRLFDRQEPEIATLKQALEAAIAEYLAGLPAADERHPLLRHRDVPLRITGSWSVRLTGSGRHVSHIHPLGLIGSACYLIVPEGEGGKLELGRPPADLNLTLDPMHVITPRPGLLVLFPSYIHHGTTQFTSGERLSVAFDVARDPAA